MEGRDRLESNALLRFKVDFSKDISQITHNKFDLPKGVNVVNNYQ